jgi:YD repeat-containing protein
MVSYNGQMTVQKVCLMQLTSTDTYDADGDMLNEVDAMGETTTFSYSTLDLPVQQYVNGNWLGPKYDAAGNVVSATDLVNGAVTTYQLNMLGQTVQTDQPSITVDGNTVVPVTTDSYDADGELLSESLPNPTTGAAGGPTTTYSYDAFGDQVSATDPMQHTSYDTYDLEGNLVLEQDPEYNQTAFSFDTFGNEVSQSLPDPNGGQQDGSNPTTTFS